MMFYLIRDGEVNQHDHPVGLIVLRSPIPAYWFLEIFLLILKQFQATMVKIIHMSGSRLIVLLLLMAITRSLTAQDGPQAISVMTYNIWYDNPDNAGNAWSDRVAGVLKTLGEHDPDILCVQEALEHQVADLKGAGYNVYGRGRDDGDKAGEFTAIFYNPVTFNQIESGVFWLSEYPDSAGSVGWDAVLPRTVTWVKLQVSGSGKNLYVFNTHFSHVGEKARLESARLLKEKITEVSGNVPVILTGDFNCKPGSAPHQVLADPSGNNVLADTRFVAEKEQKGKEFTFVGAVFTGVPGDLIDHIFVSSGWTVSESFIFDNCIDGRCPSDHLPVVAILQQK